MANPTGAFGFAPVGSLNGGPYSGGTQRVYMTASGATAVFVGDTVKMVAGSASADGYPQVLLCGATDAPYGVVVGCEAIKTNLEANNYRPASTAAYLHVVPVENALFRVRLDGTEAAAKTDVGATTIYVVAAGSTVTGLSGILLSTTNAGVSTADECRIMAVVDRPDNDPALANAEVIIKFNDNQTATATAGV